MRAILVSFVLVGYLWLHGTALPARENAYRATETHVIWSPGPRSPRYVIVPPYRAYSYGWFGAAPRRHAAAHLGYPQNYFQWSIQ